ncbi:topology modulation protein [Paenibacillus konkukensis]|uniref:Topology modulation protein n=2 Tax=Paenibacillus konkukensis TaxID=2020716 RepID=A0ABY4RPW4_9BACL|nr:topology modulation protein [Paenibacillus konkukensis]
MEKVFIIGIVASGKTTLAKRLSEKIKVPWYELDCIVHHQTAAGRYKRTAEEQMEVINNIDMNGSWIFEGTDRESYRCLLEMADTIIFLDTPLWKRKLRIFTRFLKQKIGIEPCHYKSDLKMLNRMYQWTRDFESKRESFEARLLPHKSKVIRLTDSRSLHFVT